MTSKTGFISQESPANALALNKDNSQVVIAGRNVFKIFTLYEDKFEEACNLRVGKNLNLNFSCNDIAWNLIDHHILATAATNGAVVLWNLNKVSRSKQEHVFTDHKRTVNKVSFHMTEPMWLISGSQDGTMKCFDLRIKEAVKTFYSNTESVRDVQFSPHQQHTFAAVSENGHVQQWDLRRPDRYYQYFTAHSGPIFACDWHPEMTWLATASRDKTIKIWDLSIKPKCFYTINTIASVGRIRWRPQRKYHIASCALVVDCSINVWDIRRPFIPFASFNEHKDVPTGVAWRGNPQSFLSTSRDCTLYHHLFQDATRPANKANPQGIALNCNGDVAYACKLNNYTTTTTKPLKNSTRKIPTSSDQFCMATSIMHRFTLTTKPRGPKWFKICAEEYLLSGRLSDICDKNAKIASSCGRHDVCAIWNIIKTLYESPPKKNYKSNNGLFKKSTNIKNIELSLSSSNDVKKMKQNGINNNNNNNNNVSIIEDDIETDEISENFIFPRLSICRSDYRILLNDHKRDAKGDFFFGESELDPMTTIDYNNDTTSNDDTNNNNTNNNSSNNNNNNNDNSINNNSNTNTNNNNNNDSTNDNTATTTTATTTNNSNDNDNCGLNREAFPLRHEIQDRSPPPEQYPNNSPEIIDGSVSAIDDQPCQLVLTNIPKPLFWDPTEVVKEALKHHAAIRDVQTSATILIALGNKRNNLNFEIAIQEHWLLEYIDMLARFKLYNVITQIIQLAWIPSVSQLNQQSTMIHVCCTSCTKPLQRSAWICDRCHTSKHALCSICHQVVKGVYAWCQGCTHGGHVLHMKEWFINNRCCPTGCGHICEYT
ncbi:GATOR complex protein WDR24 [Aphidius gifuensis]|uniref:GATOR complex protein WDR24 n=1 Tax=Aphidius gifuensis TaxID=684658 RepID=UPI001CDD6058|nr:GATOR complex protein WDR24 [Aphidius gifuensis]